MSAQTASENPALVEELLTVPGAFAFPQAVDIARRWLLSNGADGGEESFHFCVNPSLSFPPGDIHGVEFGNEDPITASMMLNLMGLHGAGSPLPAYFTEQIAQNADDMNPLRDFFDLLNQPFVSLLYGSWLKYRYYAQYLPGGTDKLSQRFFAFIGARQNEIRNAKDLKWSRLMAYMGLIAMSGEAAGSLESILRHYFSHESIEVVPCIKRWVEIPEDQRTYLGERNCTLGENFVMGEEVQDQTGKFRIRISNLDWDEFNSFLPTDNKFNELQILVQFVLRSRLDFDIELRLNPDEIRPWVLDDSGDFKLGWTTWAGDGGNGVIILDTNYLEL